MNICHVGATFLFTFFYWKFRRPPSPLDLRLAEQLVPCSVPPNALARFCLHLNIRFSQMVARAGCPPHNPARSPTFVCTYACPSTKVSLRRDLLCSLRLIKEKTGHKK
ncbi:hypothetical protein GW17_00004864 [Ensete ventricosum]|nr:hypothetical protein GW17_00004864 [Ensete ventricosum]